MNANPQDEFAAYLRAGDVIAYAGQVCTVIKVTESWATVAIEQPRRTFQTLFGKTVSFKPSPRLDHISPNSCVPIIRRKAL